MYVVCNCRTFFVCLGSQKLESTQKNFKDSVAYSLETLTRVDLVESAPHARRTYNFHTLFRASYRRKISLTDTNMPQRSRESCKKQKNLSPSFKLRKFSKAYG